MPSYIRLFLCRYYSGGSDTGAEMAAVYLSIVSTVKLAD